MKLNYSSKSKIKLVSNIKSMSKEKSPRQNLNLSLITDTKTLDKIEEKKEFNSINHDDCGALKTEEDEIIVNMKENVKAINTKDKNKLNNMFRPKQAYLNNPKELIKQEIKKDSHVKTPKGKNGLNLSHMISNTMSIDTKEEAQKRRVSESNVNYNQFKLNEKTKEIETHSIKIKSIDDISLSFPIIKKYYNFFLIENMASNLNNSSSFNKNNIFNNLFDEKVEKQDDYIKLIEGTNELILFSREKRKQTKIKINIDKTIFGFSKFPVGCKILQNQGNVYISGGKDLAGEKSLFWCYNIKDNKLIKLSPSKFCHCYHSLIYHEGLKAILVIGGENNSKCEMYDLYLNIWTSLPDLIVPRAKVNVHIDSMGTFIYSIFGIEGNITSKNSFSEAIEILNVNNISSGWAKIDYNKKASVDLKSTDLRVIELTSDKLLFYGAVEGRDNGTSFIVFDLRNFDLYQVDQQTVEKIKMNRSLPLELNFK